LNNLAILSFGGTIAMSGIVEGLKYDVAPPMDAQTPTREIQPIKSTRALIVGIAALWLILPRVEAGVSLTTRVSFNSTNGTNPGAGLVQGKDGNFYGTTAVGGASGYGSLFQLTPSGTLATLISFDKTNGAYPSAALVPGSDDAFYGTTEAGGTNDNGTIFEVTTGGTLTTLVSFNGTNGARPHAALVQGQYGKFYGTTEIGGTNDAGTAFQMLPNGTLTSLVSFDDSGYSPYAGLVQAADGNFYGAAFLGGTKGFGAIFRIATNGALTTLYSFSNGSDGANPYAGLTQGADGELYGTTFFGGASGYGTVFKITTNGTLTPLASFGGTNGANPQAALLLASDGNFYGTTESGGAYTNKYGSGYGTVFKLTTNGTLTTLASFNGTNGAHPLAGLVQALDGSFYGTTANGGTNGYGTIFRLTVPLPPKFQAVQETGATLTLTWSATVGETYQMLYRTNLNQTDWVNFGSTVVATNASMTTLDAIGPDRQRFYRIKLLP
jgi:uncharacterized repeat protein (TIGR03803 family)